MSITLANVSCRYPTIYFGHYKVPNISKPMDIFIDIPIEWLVLEIDKENNRVLLLSKYVLDWEGYANCPIFSFGNETSWEASYLRRWLNNSFCEESFSEEEIRRILPTVIENGNPDEVTVTDEIFFLSKEEIEKYLPAEAERITYQPIVYGGTGDAKSPIKVGYDPCFWWTRTLGETADLVVCVTPGGELWEMDSNSNENGVRPAMWIKL